MTQRRDDSAEASKSNGQADMRKVIASLASTADRCAQAAIDEYRLQCQNHDTDFDETLALLIHKAAWSAAAGGDCVEVVPVDAFDDG